MMGSRAFFSKHAHTDNAAPHALVQFVVRAPIISVHPTRIPRDCPFIPLFCSSQFVYPDAYGVDLMLPSGEMQTVFVSPFLTSTLGQARQAVQANGFFACSELSARMATLAS